ncbi:MAG: hypothetical protein QW767_01310 [Thermoprotei archaeon]
MNIGVIVLSPTSESISRVKAVVSVAHVLPGLEDSQFGVIENGVMPQLLNPVYAAVATPNALSQLAEEATSLSKTYDKIIFIKGENEPAIVEHSVLHELGHVSYQSLFPEKVARRQRFYTDLKERTKRLSKLAYLMGKVYSVIGGNPKARVLLTLESDELYANRFAYTHNTDRSAYSTLARRELQIALKIWEKRSAGQQFEAAFHMVLVDLYMRILNESWYDFVPYSYKWLLPYTTSVVDAVDAENPEKLFARVLLLFNAVHNWVELTEDELLRSLGAEAVIS